MRFAAAFLLVIFFVVLCMVALLAGAVKFQLLDIRFWQETFTKHNVYQDLASKTKDSLESQIGKEGGSRRDAKVLTDLITPENVKDFVDKNLQNVLGFANGNKTQVIVYLPVDKLPKNILPWNLSEVKNEMALTDLLTKLNYQNYNNLDLKSLGQAGKISTFVFIGSLALIVLFLIFLVLLVESGGRFVAPAVAILLSGLFIISAAKVVESLKSLQGATQDNSSFVYVLAGIVLPALADGLARVWLMVGAGLVILGLVLFFIKKPRYNNPK